MKWTMTATNDNFKSESLCKPCQYSIPMIDKSLEVLEREFSLKFPGPYKVFKEEQNRLLKEFIETYSKNHEEV